MSTGDVDNDGSDKWSYAWIKTIGRISMQEETKMCDKVIIMKQDRKADRKKHRKKEFKRRWKTSRYEEKKTHDTVILMKQERKKRGKCVQHYSCLDVCFRVSFKFFIFYFLHEYEV